jgi:hypothetical protein
LDNLTPEERKTAEAELIKTAHSGDTWQLLGLGHMKSTDALPTLYSLLGKSREGIKVTVAHSIFQICNDPKMVDIVLEEVPKSSAPFELIDILYLLPAFKDRRVTALLHSYRDHKEYLVAYNATRALGLPTDDIVNRFRNEDRHKSI